MKYVTIALPFLVLLLIPFQTDAIIGVPFGGHVISTIPCTCSGGEVVTFDRFFGASVPAFGASLFYQPPAPVFSSIGLGIFPLVPFTWLLGQFIPSPPVIGFCTEGIPPACTPIPTPPIMGIIEYVGTSGPSL